MSLKNDREMTRCLAQLVELATLKLRIVSVSPVLGMKPTLKKKKEKKRGVRGSDLCPCVVKECRVPRVEAEGP